MYKKRTLTCMINAGNLSVGQTYSQKKFKAECPHAQSACSGAPYLKEGLLFVWLTFLVTLQEQTLQPLIGQIFDR